MQDALRIRSKRRPIRRSFTYLIAFGAMSAAAPGTVTAQLRGCDVTDARCLDEAYAAPCMAQAAPWPENCEALLSELLSHPRLDNEPEVLAKAAFAHQMLARAAESDAEAAMRDRSARDLYLRVIALDPNHSDAYLGLATLSGDDLPQQIDWLREALRARGPNSIGSRTLATALDRLGTREAQLEASAVLQAAYDAQPAGLHKWYLGRSILARYALLGLDSAAREFRRRAGEDVGARRLLDALAAAVHDADADAAIEALRTVCDNNVIAIVGLDTCIDGIVLAFDAAARENDSPVSYRLAHEALVLMRSTAGSFPDRIDRAGELLNRLEQLQAAGHRSFELYFALGRCHLDLGDSVEAMAALDEAGSLATGRWRDEIDRYVAIARDPERRISGQASCVPQRIVMD